MGRQHRPLTRVWAAVACLLVSGLLLAACTRPAESGRSAAADPEALSVATGTTGGLYHPIGQAMAEILDREVDGVRATAEATGASVENLRLLAAGESDLALAQGDVVYQAYHGQGAFDEEPISTRTLMVLYPNVYHAVSLQETHEEQALDCFGDLRGRRVSVGAPGSGNELATTLVFEALGMSPEHDVRRQRYAYAETARGLRDGRVDAGAWVVGEGHGSLGELEATHPIHLVPLCPAEQEAVVERFPFYTAHTIPRNTYATVPEEVPTVALWNVLSVPEGLSEERGYELAAALYENVDALGRVYEAATAHLTPRTLRNSPVPLHPGVLRYAEEQGVDVPAELRP